MVKSAQQAYQMRNVVEPDEVTSSRDPVGCALGSLPHFDAIQGPLVGALAPARRRGEPPRPLWCVQGHQLPPRIGWHALARLTRASRAHGGETGGGTAVRLAATACAVLTSGLRSQMATDLTSPASRLTSGSSAGDRVPPATPQLAAQLAKLIDSVPPEKRKRVLEQAGVAEVASSRERIVDQTLTIASSLSVVHFYIGSDLISKLSDRVTKADKISASRWVFFSTCNTGQHLSIIRTSSKVSSRTSISSTTQQTGGRSRAASTQGRSSNGDRKMRRKRGMIANWMYRA